MPRAAIPILTLLTAMAAAGQPAPQPGAAPLRLTLQQAVAVALSPEGNTRVLLSGEAERQAGSRTAQARAALLPNLDTYVSEQNQTRNLAAFGIQVQVPIPGFVFPTLVGPYNVFDARVQATQTVFDFSAIRRYQAAKTNAKAAGAESESAREQTAAQAASLYLQALAEQAHVEAAQANVDLAQATAQLSENRKNAGTGTGIEVTRAQVELANARQRLLVAENNRRRARLELLRGLSLKLDTPLELEGKLEYAPAPTDPVDKIVEQALATRPDWKAQQTRETSAQLNYSGTKFERLPSVSAFGDYGSIGTGITNASPTRTYGVTMRVPIFDGGRRDARRAESFSQLRQEKIRTADLRQQVELDVRLALDSLRSAEEQFKVAEEGLSQAEREVAQAQRRYDAGVANSLEPIDAETRLARARDNRIAALLSYNLARINLSQATGTIRQLVQQGVRP